MKKFISLFLTLCMAVGISQSSVIASNNKIDAELLAVIEDMSSDESVPIWLWLKDIDDEVIDDAIIEESGLNPSIYENEELFNDEIVPELTQQVEDAVGYEEAHKEVPADKLYSDNIDDSVGDENYIDAPITLIDKAINDRIEEYLSFRRTIVKREYSSYNEAFINKYLSGQEDKILYNSEYTPTLVVEATKSEINTYAKDNKVEDISLYTEINLEDDINLSLDHIYAGYNDCGIKNNYKGTGVKVGIMESGGVANSASPHLSNSIASGRVTISNDAGVNGSAISTGVSTHATGVTSIITGDSVTYNGYTYEGVVPLATVYQTPVGGSFMADTLRGFQKLADKGVSVINLSASNKTSGSGYVEFDKEIDRLIASTGVTFVNTPGNGNSMVEARSTVNSPGKAHNAITLANVASKTSATSSAVRPYPLYSSASYTAASYLTNKPDIAAPGTLISFMNTSTNVYTGSGTSFAAPITTGVIAQMMQVNPWLKTNPVAVKAKLLLAADDKGLKQTSDNPIAADSQYLRDKSGAGLLDAIAAINAAKSKYDIDMSINALKEQKTKNYYFRAGQKLRAVMVYSKENTNLIKSRDDMDIVDFHLRKADGTSVASSISDRNNVRIIEYQFDSDGFYYFSINPRQLVKNAGETEYAGVKTHISFQCSDLIATVTDLDYDGMFYFTSIKFSDDMLVYRNKPIYIVINKHSSDSSVTTIANETININNAGIGVYNSNRIEFDIDDSIEILTYEDMEHQSLISRELIN